MNKFTTIACLVLTLTAAVVAAAEELHVALQNAMLFGSSNTMGKSVILMGPGVGAPYRGDFENIPARPAYSGLLAAGWTSVDEAAGVGDFGRVWSLMGDLDGCASNYSHLVAFIDDGLVVPGTGPTVGGPGNDYGPPGGYIVNNTGGLRGSGFHLGNAVCSPVMTCPVPHSSSMSLEFDVYRHELLIPEDTPGVLYTWAVRSTVGGNIAFQPWRDRNFAYYGGPGWYHSVNRVDDLISHECTEVQVKLGAYELGHVFGFGEGTNGSPAPYFDNVVVTMAEYCVRPFIAAAEIHLANDNFPAVGTLDLVDLSANSVRFDMAANISPRADLRNDPGDSICVDVTSRPGAALETPVMYWKFAVKNPSFGNDVRTGIYAGQMEGSVVGKTGGAVPNRYSYDLPDTGMLFPGDVLHYYISATDHVGGDTATATIPANLTGFGDSESMAWPGAFTVHCLPSLTPVVDPPGWIQPTVLFWNDSGSDGRGAEWMDAYRELGLLLGRDFDVFTTRGASSGVGNGLGGRATVSQIAGYTELLYSAGDLGAFTLSNGDISGDPGNDLALLNDWFALGGRDAFMTGDDLASSLASSGAVASNFLETWLGLTCGAPPIDSDIRDNIGNQVAPTVRTIAFFDVSGWIAYGGCPDINAFDNVQVVGAATVLAKYAVSPAPGAPLYPYPAAVRNEWAGNKVVSMPYDLGYVIDIEKVAAPKPARVMVLSNVLDYFGVVNDPGNIVDVPPSRTFSVVKYPNPFNPSLTIKYTLKNPGNVVMKVFNVRGELVKTLINGPVDETAGSVVWDGTNDLGSGVASGVYFVETRTNGEVNLLKATMVK